MELPEPHMFAFTLASLKNQFRKTEGKVITAFPRSLLEEKRRRMTDSIPPGWHILPSSTLWEYSRDGVFPTLNLVTPKHFLKRSQIHVVFPKGQVQKPEIMHVRKNNSGLCAPTHRSRVEFSCSLSLSMTGWIPSMRNSYLRWSLKSRLSCEG